MKNVDKTPSADQKTIAKKFAAVFDCPMRVIVHHDDVRKDLSMYVFNGSDRPVGGVTSYGTIGLSDFPLRVPSGEAAFRIELVAACASDVDLFPNALVTVAFKVQLGEEAYPGAIFSGVIEMYEISDTMSDMMLIDPYLWGERFKSEIVGEKRVAWLQAIPISRQESKFARENGADALIDRFVDEQIDVFDINRESVV